MAPGLATFRGVERRFQLLGEVDGAMIVDDYAHHPTEVRATIEAARSAAPDRRLVVAFQPHLFSRTRDFAREFGEALSLADVVYLARHLSGARAADGGRDERPDRRRDERAGARSTLARGHAPSSHQRSREICGAGDLIVTMGAGDVTRVGPALLAALGAVPR